MAEAPRMPIESGCPDPIQYMHPTMRRNYGQWAYHDRPRPGVLHHTSKNSEEFGQFVVVLHVKWMFIRLKN